MRNKGFAIGRLTRAPKELENKDGSKKVFITVAVPEAFKKADGSKKTNFIQLQALIKKDVKGPFAYMDKGDLIAVDYSVKSTQYEKNGETVYEQFLFVEGVEMLQSSKQKSEKEAATESKSADDDFGDDEIPF